VYFASKNRSNAHRENAYNMKAVNADIFQQSFGPEDAIDSFSVTSHSCKLNICLGGGGFDCIAFYAGTSFVFDVGQQVATGNFGVARDLYGPLGPGTDPSLPPPFPAIIIGGTGRYVQL
jgi:hypothetical protein